MLPYLLWGKNTNGLLGAIHPSCALIWKQALDSALCHFSKWPCLGFTETQKSTCAPAANSLNFLAPIFSSCSGILSCIHTPMIPSSNLVLTLTSHLLPQLLLASLHFEEHSSVNYLYFRGQFRVPSFLDTRNALGKK